MIIEKSIVNDISNQRQWTPCTTCFAKSTDRLAPRNTMICLTRQTASNNVCLRKKTVCKKDVDAKQKEVRLKRKEEEIKRKVENLD